MKKYIKIKIKCIEDAYIENKRTFTKDNEYLCDMLRIDCSTINDTGDRHLLSYDDSGYEESEWVKKHFAIVSYYVAICKLIKL